MIVSLGASSVYAGGPLIIFDEDTRTPYAYPLDTIPVPVYTDLGPNGLLTNAESDAHTVNGYAQWTNVPTSYLSAAVVGDFSTIPAPEGPLPDIDGFNAGLVVGTDNGGGVHVMYDNDQSITQFYFGAPPGVLGISSPEWAITGTPDLWESWTVINGDAADPTDIGGASYAGVFTHEFGHSINLAHTQTQGGAIFFGDGLGPDACATPFSDALTLSDTETMYPFIDPSPGSTGVYQATVDLLDDIAALSDIYATGGWPGDFGTITGKVFDADGTTELTGINVICRNVSNPYKDAQSALSGDYTQGYDSFGWPIEDGLFTFTGLTPGDEYVIYIDEIILGGFSTTPISIPGLGQEEYWNAAESGDPATDDVCEWTLIAAAAGSPVTADIIVNGDPYDLGLGDDDYAEVVLPFMFPFCGMDYTSVFVNSNGSVTFGEGDTDYSESVDDFLDGPPRIAMMWDDLNPTQGGSIRAMPDGADFVVSFINVPEYYSTGSNTWHLTLRADGTYDIDYGEVTAPDGISGRTLGNGAEDPGETDLTMAPQPIGELMPTVYEHFSGFDNDLSDEFLAYTPCVIPDPPEIVWNPGSFSAVLLPGEMITQTLTLTNLGDLDLEFDIGSDQLFAVAASDAVGGILTEAEFGPRTEPNPQLDDARLGRMLQDRQVSRPGKPELSPYNVALPHAFALALLSEDFNSGFPAGWSVVDNIALGVTWTVPQQGEGNYTGGSGDAVGASSDWFGPAAFDTELRTPPITSFGPNVVLSYVVNYANFANYDYLDVDVSTDGGMTWATVLSWNEDHGPLWGTPGEQVSLNLDPFVAGAEEFIVRWRYYDPDTGAWDWYAQIDDVLIVSDEVLTPCSYLTVAPTSGTIPADGSMPVDVTFDATGFDPGTYDCELIVFNNSVNEPRVSIPLQMVVAQEVAFDIKPGSCPNPFNVTKRGIMPVAALGSAEFDISDIDVSSLLLVGVEPLRSDVEDVSSPFDWDDCECSTGGHDGFADLTLKFDAQNLAAALGEVFDGQILEMRLMGNLLDGTTIIGRDCVKIISNGRYVPESRLSSVTLDGAAPNPFNPVTRISFYLPNESFVKLSVFDVKGRLLEQLVSGVRPSGEQVVQWDATGFASGIYFYRLEVGSFVQTRKMILLK
jgi:hypothetical protein